MRDLAEQNFAVKRQGVRLKVLWILLLVIVSLAIYFARSRFLPGGVKGGSIVLQEAPRGLTPVAIESPSDFTEKGVNLTVDRAVLTDVAYDGSGKGSATRTYGAGSYSLSVSATLPNPGGGDRYQVWLVSVGSVVDAGFMNGSGTSWGLVFRDKDKYAGYDEVWVTREITTEDGKPEKHVLEGSF